MAWLPRGQAFGPVPPVAPGHGEGMRVRRRFALRLAAAVAGLIVLGCGGRTDLAREVDADVLDARRPEAEVCNGRDDDLDGSVDEEFRDKDGRYVHDDHCGGCGRPCRADGPDVVAAACDVIEGSPVCAASACVEGYTPSSTGDCVPAYERLCGSCLDDADCGGFEGARCADLGDELRCTIDCGLGCPDGYTCSDEGLCVPEGGSCSCDPGDHFGLACALEDPEGERCPGHAVCDDGSLSACEAPPEACDERDNDCDGEVDETFRNDRGGYDDIHNCGECGVDCTESETGGELELTCGGDPFAPRCVLRCPDAEDGIMPGDEIDADGDIGNGCECTVTSLEDEPGPVGASGEDLDLNCDGADGVVVESLYVASDGDDDGPGSPTEPLATISEAVERAAESFGTERPRPHVFVASGNYTESVDLADGVKLHGGYRRDFRALQPTGFRVEIRAPSETDAPGGAALTATGAGREPTVVEWVAVRGRDATEPSSAAFGAVLDDAGPELVMRDMAIRSGEAGSGTSGADGEAGSGPARAAGDGDPPRASEENAAHRCIARDDNTVAGGDGGRNECDGTEVDGGDGGSAQCPRFADFQPSGEDGSDAGPVSGGDGGQGGQDSQGPIESSSPGCNEPTVCCGLADFTVPSDFAGPGPGDAGDDGPTGEPGRGCADSLGRFDGGRWVPAEATAGTAGRPGSGGGGGGAGGGAEIEWYDGQCEFPDGLGGGGGGGGAGGCGGGGGAPGTSGGPSVALLVRYARSPDAGPTLDGVRIAPGDGGRGGNGGAGGEGGLGGTGGFGGALPREERSTPTLAGPFPGARGGPGGDGGDGGGGGGGCGGASIGIWVTGVDALAGVDAWRMDNDFELGRPGTPGEGGGGGAPGGDGDAGGAHDVLVR